MCDLVSHSAGDSN